jgi:hypothetical protein
MKGKLQTPGSKLQRNIRLQAPKAAHGDVWNLKFGASLELGAWCLELKGRYS